MLAVELFLQCIVGQSIDKVWQIQFRQQSKNDIYGKVGLDGRWAVREVSIHRRDDRR